MKRVLINKNEKHLVNDPGRDFHTRDGFFKAEELRKDGPIKSSKGAEFYVFGATFSDEYERLKRGPQIITRKDIGAIIAECGIGRKSVVFEAGSGSGVCGIFIANIAKKVISYDIDKRSIEITKKNIEMLGVKNMAVKEKSAYEPVKEKNIDVAILDLPEPWRAVPCVIPALKKGGFIAVYSPNITQVLQTVDELPASCVLLSTVEVILRPWQVGGRIARPEFGRITHTGFLTFMRKIN